jgi:uridylate kinase
VDGVFSADPVTHPDAKRYNRVSFEQVLRDNLGVMDATAVVMCRDNRLPMRVFNIHNKGDLLRIMHGEDIGTLVTADASDEA